MINAATALLITAEQNALQRSRAGAPEPAAEERNLAVNPQQEEEAAREMTLHRVPNVSVDGRAYTWDATRNDATPAITHATVRRDGTAQINVEITSQQFQDAAESLAVAMRRLGDSFTNPQRGPIRFPEDTELAPAVEARL